MRSAADLGPDDQSGSVVTAFPQQVAASPAIADLQGCFRT
jgi:hypothetical protein